MKPEATFAARVRLRLQPFDIDIERIENRVNLGVPDMLIGAGERFVPVELKVVARGLKVALRPHQIAFMTRHAARGRPCFVLVLRMPSKLRAGLISLYKGSQAIELAARGLDLPPVCVWAVDNMPWRELAEHLLGKTPIK